MKQHITKEQLGELTPEQQERLRERWEPQDGDLFIDGYGDLGIADSGVYDDPPTIPDRDCLPLLSIGQCIELLELHGEIDIDLGGTGIILFHFLGPINPAEELIDYFWDVVKEVL